MTFIELFLVFFMIGLFTIGGGYAMLPMIVDQVVGKGWLSFEVLNSFIAIAESTPGPFAINTASLVGFKVIFAETGSYLAAILGSILTTTGVILPSFLIILVIAKYFDNFMKIKWVKDALAGIKAIVVGLIFAVVIDLFIANLFGPSVTFKNLFGSLGKFDLFALIIIIIVFGIKFVYKKFSPILLIVLSGVLGIIFYYVI